MRYDWRCTCGATVEVVRTMTDCLVGPRHECPRCRGHDFRKQVSRPEVLVPGGKSERSPYPFVLPKAEKFFDYERGVVVTRDVVFHSFAEQKEWMDRHDKVLYMDGEADSTFNSDSQKSVFTQGETAPPTPAAQTLSEQMFYVESPAEVGLKE